MFKSKLVSLLKKFSKDEFKKFGQFIRSPYFNSEVVLINLYDELKIYFPDFENESLDKKIVFAKLYTKKQYNDELMRNIISDMLNITEEFLVYNSFGEKTFLKKILLLRELTDKRQMDLFNKRFRQALSLLEDSLIKDENYYYNQYLLEDEKTWNLQSSTSKIKIKEDNFNKAAEAFIHYTLVEIIKQYSIMLNQIKYIYDFDYSFIFLDEILKYIESNKELTEQIPYLDLYYNSIMLFKTEKKEYFDKLRWNVKKNFEVLNQVDRKNVYVVLVNHCSEQINRGRFVFIKERFELYKEIIGNNIHYEGNKFISHIFFINVVSNSLELHEFKWCETFINKYSNEILDEFRANTYHFCMALVHFEKNKFDESLVVLSRVHFSDTVFKLNVNCLELMIYYSTDSTEPFISLIDSFRHMLSNKKEFSKRRIELSKHFITTIKKLYNLKQKKNAESDYDVLRLKTEIQEINYTFGKSWLLKKVTELI